ncbi:MAG TPA: hypothetical protein VFY69_05535 [Solirubrobacterales bacterium]|nr:hypothetical protein [Solirubrobacterales bacterium]
MRGGGDIAWSRAAGAVGIALVLLAASAAAASAGPSPFRHDLHRIDGRLRMAIEYGPAELGEGLIASEAVCRAAERAEGRGDGDQAAADRSVLSQLVEEVDRPTAGRIDSAFRRADSGLRALRDRYSSAWSDPAKLRQLRRGVAGARVGIRMMRAAMERVEGSFDAWQANRCRDARRAIDGGAAKLPAGVEQVNRGMLRLWELAFPQRR